MSKIVQIAVVLAAAGLAGCGGDAPQAAPGNAAPKVIEKGIFISASDCAATGKASLDQCGGAIDKAVAEHLQTATVYTSLTRCEAARGRNRCDKTVDGYRGRLQAFLVTLDTPATAVGLYPSSAGAGFKTGTGQSVSALDDTLVVSREAFTLANDNAKLSK